MIIRRPQYIRHSISGPTGWVAVGMVDGEYIINPDSEQREKSKLAPDSLVEDAIMMEKQEQMK